LEVDIMKKRILLLVIILAASAVFVPFGINRRADQSSKIRAFVNGFVIDGSGKNPISNGTILIQGNKIIAVGRSVDVQIPVEANKIDLEGKTILPGWIDSHVHNAFDPALRRRFLEIGITSVCDLGSPLERMEEFKIDFFEGKPVARGLKAGPIITAPGGLPDAVLKEDLNYEIGNPNQARQAIPFFLKHGADVLKIYLENMVEEKSYPMLNENTLKALVDEAHSRNLLVRAHVTKLSLLPHALEANVDVIEHLPKPDLREAVLTEKLSKSKQPEKDLYDAVVIPEYETAFSLLINKNIILVPTLRADAGRFHKSAEANKWQKIIAQGVIDLIGRYFKKGGTIAMGTDFNPNNDYPLDMFFQEMDLLREAGLSPMDIIIAGTKNAAFVCGHAHDLGTLEPGKLADMVILEENPLENPSALRKPLAVIKNGKIFWK
jgi:imidazolonepropionase-like amidohydrolase